VIEIGLFFTPILTFPRRGGRDFRSFWTGTRLGSMRCARLPVLVGVCVVILASCGFHLRGSTTLPADVYRMHVEAPNPRLEEDLEFELQTAGAVITPERDDAEAILAATSETFNRRVIAVDAETGRNREFEVAYTIDFKVTRADGTVLLKPQNVNLLRTLVLNEDQLLGALTEEQTLQKEMRADAVRQILQRMQTTLTK